MLFLETIKGNQSTKTPVWFMRQAGRHLPEYRELRAKAGSFLDLCYNPELASEVTLQPIRRYDMDAAIVFADILLIPHALGQKLWFVAGEGPRLDPVITKSNIDQFRSRDDFSMLDPVYETLSMTRSELGDDKALIGFAGAPWTVATYMLAGGPSKDPSALRAAYYDDPVFFMELIDLLTQATISYLINQGRAGANALQLFDSWSSGLPEALMRKLCLEPAEKIASAVKKALPGMPFIMFPKGAGSMAIDFAQSEFCDAIGIDTPTPAKWALENLSPNSCVQGGLDPLLVVKGGRAMEDSARHYLEVFRDVPHVFNLGHGFLPETPIENVVRLMEIIREER